MPSRSLNSVKGRIAMMAHAALLVAGLAVTLGAMAPLSVAIAKDYARNKSRCGPFVKVAVSTAPGLCLGLVAQDVKGMRFPRGVVQVSENIYWIVDMGGWTPGRGKLWRMNLSDPKTPLFRVLDQGLDRPHGLVKDAAGRVYLGTAGAIWRYDPSDDRPVANKQRLLAGLPTQGRHPLTHLAYDPAGALVINVGAPSDHCELDEDRPGKVGNPCQTSQGPRPQAALYRAEIQSDGTLGPLRLLAEGLRNSMALAYHPETGLLLQGENNIDYKEADQPKEELNIIQPGAHYGWPYCIENQRRARHYRKGAALDCAKTQAPARLLPAHAAPLGLVFSGAQSQGRAGLTGFNNHWLLAYHGYRSTGHRIVAIEASASGEPSGELQELVFDWKKRPGRHPRGAPVGINFDSEGRLWMADDRNKAILVLISERPRNGAALGMLEPPQGLGDGLGEGPGDGPDKGSVLPTLSAAALDRLSASETWRSVYQDNLKPGCEECHGDIIGASAKQGLSNLLALSWLDLEQPQNGLAYKAILGQGGRRVMPPPKGLAPKRRESLRQELLRLSLEP